jgi:hypothetical protein
MAPGFVCTGVRDPRGPHRRRSRQWRADGVLPIPIAVDVGEGGERLFKASDALDTWPSRRPAGTWYETLPVRVTLSRGGEGDDVGARDGARAALLHGGLGGVDHVETAGERTGGPTALRPWCAASPEGRRACGLAAMACGLAGGRAGGLTAGQACGLTAIARGGLTAKDPRFGGGEEKMTWHGGTHELGRRIGKLLEQIVF